ncbi:SDR family oxidoreductase [Kineosporia rhizophila]|uniref:SDR family oxidoreductase n=1 Tax=Kineosporia rhizophila TaxID=84633 RepID=UPI001E3F9ECC|nr:SDR family oxidoreductase [Kineosporia rhizophila]MCE0536442.1 SDR family oxidoreductase [Kineosporia rhizophila]
MSETKTALVTGANKGIGYEIARQLGKLGYRVGVGSRDGERGAEAVDRLKAEGLDVFAVPLDVTSDESVQAAVGAFTELDVLVNNAGINGGAFQLPSGTDLERFRRVIDTNVFGVMRVTNAFLPLLRRSAAPRIVNLSTSMASLAHQQEASMYAGAIDGAYGPSKTLLNAVTLQYAREFADTNILVNAVCPGYVASDFTAYQGYRSTAEGAAIAVRLATVADDGPRGGFFNEEGALPW